jgi:hypothetical protein
MREQKEGRFCGGACGKARYSGEERRIGEKKRKGHGTGGKRWSLPALILQFHIMRAGGASKNVD